MKRIFLLSSLLFVLSFIHGQQIKPADMESLTGDIWTGSLMYLNYADNKPVTLPVKLAVSLKKKRQYAFAYTFPNEPHANRTSTIKIGKDYRSISKQTIVEREMLEDGLLRIVTADKGKDNGKAAAFRFTYLLGATQLIIRKEVQYAGTEQYFVRNEYSFER